MRNYQSAIEETIPLAEACCWEAVCSADAAPISLQFSDDFVCKASYPLGVPGHVELLAGGSGFFEILDVGQLSRGCNHAQACFQALQNKVAACPVSHRESEGKLSPQSAVAVELW